MPRISPPPRAALNRPSAVPSNVRLPGESPVSALPSIIHPPTRAGPRLHLMRVFFTACEYPSRFRGRGVASIRGVPGEITRSRIGCPDGWVRTAPAGDPALPCPPEKTRMSPHCVCYPSAVPDSIRNVSFRVDNPEQRKRARWAPPRPHPFPPRPPRDSSPAGVEPANPPRSPPRRRRARHPGTRRRLPPGEGRRGRGRRGRWRPTP